MAGLLFLPAFLLLITFVFASPIGATTSDQTSTTTTTTTTTHREHKVHNIVLYPDKHSWCRTTTIKQVISYPGCRSVEIDNNVCVGACFSYSIPHTEPSDPGEAIVPYCDSCQPSETAWQDVSLECSPSEPSRTTSSSSSASFAVSSDGNSSPQFVKRVQIITNCSCAPCDRNSNSLKPLSSSHTNLIPSPNDVQDDEAPSSSSSAFEQPQNDVPDLLNELQRRNESSGRRPEGLRLLMDNRIVELLQRIQETNQPEDRQQLKMFLQMIQDPLEPKTLDSKNNNLNNEETIVTGEETTEPRLRWSAAEFDKFLERLTDEHVELDTERLRDVLHVFERTQQSRQSQYQQQLDKHQHDKHQHQLERQQQFNNQQQQHAIVSVVDAASVLPPIEMRSPSDNFTNRTIERGNATTLPASSSSDGKSAVQHKATTNHHHHHHHHQHHHHHVVGEHIGSGRLVKGPHGALIVEPDEPHHERLEVSPIELKANHAGTMLSYGHDPPPTHASTVAAAPASVIPSVIVPIDVAHQKPVETVADVV